MITGSSIIKYRQGITQPSTSLENQLLLSSKECKIIVYVKNQTNTIVKEVRET